MCNSETLLWHVLCAIDPPFYNFERGLKRHVNLQLIRNLKNSEVHYRARHLPAFCKGLEVCIAHIIDQKGLLQLLSLFLTYSSSLLL